MNVFISLFFDLMFLTNINEKIQKMYSFISYQAFYYVQRGKSEFNKSFNQSLLYALKTCLLEFTSLYLFKYL